MLALAAGAFMLRLAAGPISLQDYAENVGAALAERIGPGWTVQLADTTLELRGVRPAVRATSLTIRNPLGVEVVRAPHATVSLDPVALLTGTILPRELELQSLQLRAAIARDGTLTFAPEAQPSVPTASIPLKPVAAGPAGAIPPGGPAAASPDAAGAVSKPSQVAVAVASLLDPIVGATGIVSGLDRASIRDASLTLIGPDGRERAAFARLGAVFERLSGAERRFDVELEGPNGNWKVGGLVRGEPDRAATVEATDVPLADVLLLTGLSGLPGGTDLKLSGRVETSFAAGRLMQLGGTVRAAAGRVTRPGGPPIVLDGAALEAGWDEEARILRLPVIEARSQGTVVRLSGTLAGPDGQPWRLVLSGRDAVVAGITGRDGDFKVAALSAEATFGEAGITLDRASLKGDQVDLAFSGSLTTSPAGPTVKGTVEVADTSARRMVRLWPDALNPKLRDFLAQRLKGGTIQRLRLRSVLDPDDFRNAFSEPPLTDGAIDLRFTTTGIELAVVDGLPPLRGLTLDGKATGTTASVKARDGVLEMTDGRRLVFTDGSYVHLTLDKPGTPAQIGFRLVGGADALVSLLKTPIFREAGAPDLDPATVHGQADLRLRLPLVPGKIPPLSQMALSVYGSLTDIGLDRLPGKEKLEGGAFVVSGEAGGLVIKGDARLSGTPASFELISQRAGSGDLTVTATLDDAARAKRSLPGPPVLSGPVAVKAVIALGPNAPVRVEADLARASIDGLVPGWVKPPSRPGRLSFTLPSQDSLELRDVAVDAGPTQMRGQMTFSPGGSGLERADFPTFKLSPGDDLRAQLERGPTGGYRITVRGNNGDARPLLRWTGTAGQAARPGGGQAGPGREAKETDVDVDLGLNIMTGFNDEALTGVTGKLSARGSEVRSLQFAGRFRGALLEAQLAKRDSGAPVMTVRSGDAGATLRFLDLYKRMIGGTLALDGRSGDGVQEGRISVDDFGLRNEPALARIATQAAHTQNVSEERGLAPIARGDLDQVLFKRLSADFRRSGPRTDYNDVVIYGPQVGFNVSGYVDSARDRLDMTGTFVPAYMLNNALTQLPVVGLLLGGRNEGLFAIGFRVTGPIANPALTVNPLTAVAPGILRKLFGFMLEGGEPADSGTPTAPAIPERRASVPKRP